MSKQVITEYSNQLHQLLVSVSKHLYITKNGLIKYQEKPMEVNINNYHKSRKEHLVYYILRDHFSGSFVLQITGTKSLISLPAFLYYAWSKGTEEEEKYLWGIPGAVFVPKLISSAGLLAGLDKLGVQPLNPPSGFASGVRIIRDIEENLYFLLGRTVKHTVEDINNKKNIIYQYLINPSYAESKFDKWRHNLPPGHPREVPGYREFISFFEPAAQENNPLMQVDPENSGQKKTGTKSKQKHGSSKKKVIKNQTFSREKLYQAQDFVYTAWDIPDRQKRLDLARKALDISPYCADAYILLAAESDFPEEALEFYELGVQAGRMALGDVLFKKYTGNFWGVVETRPYMTALLGLAHSLWKTGRRQQAIQHYQEMLRLNPGDNQGVRHILASCLLAEGMDKDAEQLLAEYDEDGSCFMAYSRALLSFRKTGAGSAADKHLQAALISNIHVPQYLLGKRFIPYKQPEYYALGSEEEAAIYAGDAKEAWENTPGALEWLAEHTVKN
jgi:tetratricopeptide (TPR) repeat protein